MSWLRDHAWISLVLLVAFLLRFWAFWEIPYSHDELSALLRTQVDGWNGFIETGIKMDNHPGGVQLLIWLQTIIGGYSQWWIKLPFLLSGVWSVWMLYLVAVRMFSKPVGLMSSALLATLQFPITFSQWARPYSIGLLLVIAALWALLLLRQEKGAVWKWVVAYGMLCAAAGYVHYFALLQVILLSIGFVPFLKKRLGYAALGAGIGLLMWLPHLGLTLFHLDRGGIGNWLHLPKSGYWLEVIQYVFQFDMATPVVLILASISVLVTTRWYALYSRYYLLMMSILPYVIGYLYSINVSPLLHQSVLIFSLPFFLMFCSSFVTHQRPFLDFALVLVMAININVLIIQRSHYQVNYSSEYESPLKWLKTNNNDSKGADALVDLRNDFVYMMFDLGITPESDLQFVEPLLHNGKIGSYLDGLQNDHLFFAMNSGTEPEVFAAVLDRYPCIDSVQYYHAGEAYWLSRSCESRRLLDQINGEQVLHSEQSYSKSLMVVMDGMLVTQNIHATAKFDGGAEDANLVVDVQSDLSPSWRGVQLNRIGGAASEKRAYNVYYASEWELNDADRLKSFVWLNSEDTVTVNDLKLYAVPVNTNKFKLFKAKSE